MATRYLRKGVLHIPDDNDGNEDDGTYGRWALCEGMSSLYLGAEFTVVRDERVTCVACLAESFGGNWRFRWA